MPFTINKMRSFDFFMLRTIKISLKTIFPLIFFVFDTKQGVIEKLS